MKENMYSYKLNDSYYVELDILNRKFREISHGFLQWMAVPVPWIFMAPEQQPRSCALVGYGTFKLICWIFPI